MKRYCGKLEIELVWYEFFFNAEVKEVNGPTLASLKGLVAHGLKSEMFHKDQSAGYTKLACLAIFAASLVVDIDELTEVNGHKLVIKDGKG